MQANPTAATPPTGEPTTARTGIDLRRFPWVKRLAADYAFAFGGLAPFFSGDPTDDSAWAAAIARAQAHPRDRQQLARAIGEQQRRRGAPAQAARGGRSSRRPDGRRGADRPAGGTLRRAAVYTLLKAITALKLADQVSRRARRAGGGGLLDRGRRSRLGRSAFVHGPRRRARVPRPSPCPSARRASRCRSPPSRSTISIAAALAELEQMLPATEFRDALLADLRAAYQPGTGMAEAFGRWMERVLGERGLVVYDASDPATKPLGRPGVRARAVDARRDGDGRGEGRRRSRGAAGITRRCRRPTAAWRCSAWMSRGAAHPAAGRPARHRRRRRYAPAALAKEAGERPAAFSPSVLLRPIVQDALFPTICYVAGPSELAYLGQLRGVYEHFGVPMPLMYPRATATLVDSAAVALPHQVSVAARSAAAAGRGGAERAAQDPDSAGRRCGVRRAPARDRRARCSAVVDALPALDPTLEGAARIDARQDAARSGDAPRQDDSGGEAARRNAAPAVPPHARARLPRRPRRRNAPIGFVWFLNQYGPALVERLWRRSARSRWDSTG